MHWSRSILNTSQEPVAIFFTGNACSQLWVDKHRPSYSAVSQPTSTSQSSPGNDSNSNQLAHQSVKSSETEKQFRAVNSAWCASFATARPNVIPPPRRRRQWTNYLPEWVGHGSQATTAGAIMLPWQPTRRRRRTWTWDARRKDAIIIYIFRPSEFIIWPINMQIEGKISPQFSSPPPSTSCSGWGIPEPVEQR